MAQPATTPDVDPTPPKLVARATGKGPVDPRKQAVQELANAQKALFDAEDALTRAEADVAAKTKALAALRNPAPAGKRS